MQVSGEGQDRMHQSTLSSPLPHWQTEQRMSNSGREQGRGRDAGKGLKVRRQRRNHSCIHLFMGLTKDGLQETTLLNQNHARLGPWRKKGALVSIIGL